MKDYISFFGNYQDMDLYQNAPANDWQDLTFGRTGTSFNQSLSITGGSESMRYSFNFSHVDDKAIMQKSNFKRDNLSLKLNNKVNEKIALDFSARYSDTKIFGGGAIDTQSPYDSDRRLKYSVSYTPIPLKTSIRVWEATTMNWATCITRWKPLMITTAKEPAKH
jgi:hypothetical protein